jgi:acetyl-CoA carboxylase biotin carboxyl carrier protein
MTLSRPTNGDDFSDKANVYIVKSPMVGTFYSAPSPDSQPFIAVGSKVEKESVLCILEAMKVMNEIQSDVSGVVREILVNNGQPVEFNQKLFAIELT